MQQIIWTLQLFQLYMCHSNTLYAKLPTATETLQPSRTPKRLERRAVPSEMIACGYQNGDPAAMTTAESGSVCRFSTKNGIWRMCRSSGDSKCTLAGRCRDQHECAGGCGKTDNPKFRMTSCDTTAATETSTTSSGSATEATAEISDDNRSESRSDTGAIVGGVVGGPVVLCATTVAVLYLLRKSRTQKLETTPEMGQGMIEAPGQAETDNRPKELVGSKPSGVLANR
ncbi:hypothetical protein FANTH_5987 [Fusarium anthophilum]|uniref:Uncharacterized protein n=1 Tax=Fusarium anthophilum TaxID=48485 RepID=A0A8H5E5R3_9HYPO|nr:hypothetical protein FANTH_5987 [Fusarium anthophilum]